MNNNIHNLMMICKGIYERKQDLDTLISDTLKDTLLAYKQIKNSNTITISGLGNYPYCLYGCDEHDYIGGQITFVAFDDSGKITDMKVNLNRGCADVSNEIDIDVDTAIYNAESVVYPDTEVLLEWKENLITNILNVLGLDINGRSMTQYLNGDMYN